MAPAASNDYSADNDDVICLDQQPTALLPVLSYATTDTQLNDASSKSLPNKLISAPQ
jgi:hypothetical protein